MKLVALLLATLSCVDAAWLRWSVNREPVWAAQETSLATTTDEVGWTPIPTPAPGIRKDGKDVLELLRRGSTTDWENSNTCGWFAGISSSAIVCGGDFTCATNSDHVVACASGTISPFYTACLDYKAFEAGSCSNLDAATGCCANSKQPACGTYIWTGSPERFMYKCFETASALSILDVPQFVLDASLFSKTHTTSTPTTTSDASETNGNNPTSAGEGNDPSGTGAAGSESGSDSGSESGSPDSNSSTSTNNSGPNTPVIVGAAVGGTISLLLLLLLLWYLKRKMKNKFGLSFNRKKKTKTEDNSTTHHHTTNVAAAKGRNSSVSEATTARPGTGQPQENHYHHQEHYHYQGHAQQQPIANYQEGGRAQTTSAPTAHYQESGRGQPGSVATTVNDNSSNSRGPLFSYTSNNTTAPGSSEPPSNIIVGGIASRPGDREKPNGQSRQQEGVPAQLQPINHIHIYHNAPMHQPENRSTPRSEAQSGNRGMQDNSDVVVYNHVHYPSERDSPAINHARDQCRAEDPSQERERSQDPAQPYDPRDHGHTRDISTVTSASGNDWSAIPAYLENAGPGYRQSM
ncbi:hypothetical protein GGR57DRAFT_342391 [Xylariaceae sp. FL1272]|nr:hypothetical protein GGR57DRAFT_342391 [Xylariaceae sp. FL1272]